jgi:hypothetical protein
VLTPGTNSGALVGGDQVEVGFAPASAFDLEVNGHALSRSALDGWAGAYSVPASSTPLVATLRLSKFPWDGLLAGFTLFLWCIIWLGFGWVHRLEWLFTGRRRPRHTRGPRGRRGEADDA